MRQVIKMMRRTSYTSCTWDVQAYKWLQGLCTVKCKMTTRETKEPLMRGDIPRPESEDSILLRHHLSLNVSECLLQFQLRPSRICVCVVINKLFSKFTWKSNKWFPDLLQGYSRRDNIVWRKHRNINKWNQAESRKRLTRTRPTDVRQKCRSNWIRRGQTSGGQLLGIYTWNLLILSPSMYKN